MIVKKLNIYIVLIKFNVPKLVKIFCLGLTFVNCFSFSQTNEIDSVKGTLKKSIKDTTQVKKLLKLTRLYNDISYSDSVISFGSRALELSKNLNYKKGMATALTYLGFAHQMTGEYSKAIACTKESLKIHENIGYKKGVSGNLQSIGTIYDEQGNYSKALDYYFRAIKISESIGDKMMTGIVLGGIANTFGSIGEFNKSLQYHEKAMNLYREINDSLGLAFEANNIGTAYQNQGNNKKALEYYFTGLQIATKIQDKENMLLTTANIGSVFIKLKEYKQSEKYLFQALNFAREQGRKINEAIILFSLGTLSMYQNNLPNAERYLLRSVEINSEIGTLENLMEGYQELNKLYGSQNDFKKAYYYLKVSHKIKDSLYSLEKQKDITRTEMNYEFEKKEALTKADHDKEAAIADADKKRQRLLFWFIAALAGSVGAIALVIFRSLRIARKQKQTIEEQKLLVEEHQKEIIDSITYAKRIQDAILPPLKLVKQKFPESFVIYKPKDIVAGDFYWMEEFDDIIFIAAADCTGHGVPGAMVSVVCSNALTRSVKEFGLRDTGKILDKTRELVIETFEKSSEDVKDGMDISLLSIDKANKKIHWSGANNPLWYFHNNDIKATSFAQTSENFFTVKADKQPIGKSEYPRPFTTHQLKYQNDTSYFLFTDGLADQFGGLLGKKFKYKQFSELLKNINLLDQEKQAQIIEKTFSDWKGKLEQVDDVCVMGIRVR